MSIFVLLLSRARVARSKVSSIVTAPVYRRPKWRAASISCCWTRCCMVDSVDSVDIVDIVDILPVSRYLDGLGVDQLLELLLLRDQEVVLVRGGL